LCAYSVFNTFPVYPLSAKPLILLAFCRYRYHTSLFNRPGFTALLEEIEAGRVDTLVVKDLSRFGRNYLQVGYYTETLWTRTQKADHETGAADNK
jgi:site-specific DNA recombinase